MFKEATIQGKISGSVMIVSVTQKQTRTSKPYLILKLRDDQKKEVMPSYGICQLKNFHLIRIQ